MRKPLTQRDGDWLIRFSQGKTSEAISKLLSLQAKEAVLLEPTEKPSSDDEKSLSVEILQTYHERCIPVELVQRGDIIKASLVVIL